MLTLKISSDRETTPPPYHTGFESQPSPPQLIGRKRPLENTPSPQQKAGERVSPAAQDKETPTSSRPITPESQITNDDALIEGARDNQLHRVVQNEVQQEEAAQTFLLCHQDNEEEDDPSEDASSGKPEKAIEELGSAFMHVIWRALKATEENDHVDKKSLDAQNLEMGVE